MTIRPVKWLPLAVALAGIPLFAHGEDLMDVYQQALNQDPQLAQQAAQSKATQEGVPLARAQLLPQLSAGLTLQQTNGNSGTFTSNPGQAGPGQSQNTPDYGHVRNRNWFVQLQQTVLDFGKYADLSAAHSQADSAEAQYQSALQGLIVRVTQAYFNVLTAQDKVAFSEANEEQLQRQLDKAQARFDAGVAAITDVEDAKAQHDSARAQLITARNELDDAREALTEITGQPVNHLAALSQQLPMQSPKPNSLATWVDQAREGNPAILAQQYNVDAANHSITSARDQRLPTLDASVQYGESATWYQDGPYRSQPGNTTIGLTLNVPIFSGGAIRAQVKQSIYQRDSAKSALVQQRRRVVRNTRNDFRSVNAGISKVKASRQAVMSNKSALDATKAGLGAGTRTIVDVLLAQQNLINSRQQYSQSRHQLVVNKLLLEQDVGDLTIDDLRAVNALLVPANQVNRKALPEALQDQDKLSPAEQRTLHKVRGSSRDAGDNKPATDSDMP